MELLEQIIEENNIPKDVHLLSDSVLEPEMYIFKPYRNKGYGTIVLKRFMDVAFREGLLRVWREKTENPPPVYSLKKEIVCPEKLVSDVSVETEYSQKMMMACGFCENKEVAAKFRLIVDEDDSEAGFVQVREFEITKERYLKMIVEHS